MGTTTPTSKRLKAWRKSIKMSQSQAAIKLGVPVKTLQNWELGRNEPRGLALTALNDMTRKPTPAKEI